MEQAKYDVFISYSRDDYFDECGIVIPGNEVSKIKDALTNVGITYWFDEEISSGHGISEEIATNIENSALFLFLSSANSNKSDWIYKEIVYADKIKKYIIPVCIDATPYNNKVNFHIGNRKYIKYYTNPQKGLDDMIIDIKTYLDKQAKDKRRKEEEEQQKQLIKDIRTLVIKLNEDETKLDLERTNLYVKTNKVIGIKQQESLKNEILESSPIRKKSQAEIKKLQGHVIELETEKNSFVEKNDELLEKFAKKDSENQSLLKEINFLKRELRSSTFRKTKWVHIVYCCIIVILISLICFRSCVEQNFRNITWLFTDTKDKQEAPAVDSILELRVDSVKFKMIWIEGGTFKMGAQSFDSSGVNYDFEAHRNESPVHNVTLNGFYMGENEVTQSLWEAVMESEPTGNGGWKDQFGKGDNYPAYNVSYDDIVKRFIPELNRATGKCFRLPTEAEWEYAARDGKKSQGYKYAGGNSIGEVAWYTENSGGNTDTVKGRKPNELGLYDMSGNVWEWCQDRYNVYSDSDQINSYGPSSGSNRVLRGGSWDYSARGCRVSYRGYYDPSNRGYDIGFRLVLPQKTSPERP